MRLEPGSSEKGGPGATYHVARRKCCRSVTLCAKRETGPSDGAYSPTPPHTASRRYVAPPAPSTTTVIITTETTGYGYRVSARGALRAEGARTWLNELRTHVERVGVVACSTGAKIVRSPAGTSWLAASRVDLD